MHKRYQPLNVPIEIVRTVVAISETGSLTKAAERLGLSQPAVSSQIKRIQGLVGGPLFIKTSQGATATQLGKLVLHQARRILDANDQMLRIGGAAHAPQPIRLGLSTLFVRQFLSEQSAGKLADVIIHTDNSVGITKGLIDGYIDIAYVFENPEMTSEISHLIVNEMDEEFVWVRARSFVLSPGAPIPLLTWPGDGSDDPHADAARPCLQDRVQQSRLSREAGSCRSWARDYGDPQADDPRTAGMGTRILPAPATAPQGAALREIKPGELVEHGPSQRNVGALLQNAAGGEPVTRDYRGTR